jgi:hypothetical protein
MKPFLIRTRIPGLATEEGAMHIIVSVAATEAQALHQAKQELGDKMTVEEVIGIANDTIKARKLNGMLIAGTIAHL